MAKQQDVDTESHVPTNRVDQQDVGPNRVDVHQQQGCWTGCQVLGVQWDERRAGGAGASTSLGGGQDQKQRWAAGGPGRFERGDVSEQGTESGL